jgi:hypothetical protein
MGKKEEKIKEKKSKGGEEKGIDNRRQTVYHHQNQVTTNKIYILQQFLQRQGMLGASKQLTFKA